MLDLGADLDVVEKSGAWYSYQGTRIGQGKDNAREYLRTHPEMALEIEIRSVNSRECAARRCLWCQARMRHNCRGFWRQRSQGGEAGKE